MLVNWENFETTAEAAATSDDQQLGMVQGAVEQGMKRDTLLTETYLQLIKQTTDHPGMLKAHFHIHNPSHFFY